MIFNKNFFLSIGYLINLVSYVLCLKSINYYFHIDHIIFSCILFGEYFPFSFLYFIYSQSKINKINIVNGILDYAQLILLYIGLNNLNVGEYLSYRTMSIIFNVGLSYYFLNKKFNIIELTGIGLILTICIGLIIVGGIKNLLYSCIILFSSFLYSLSGFIIEKYKETSDFTQIKLTSSFLSLMTYTYYSLFSTSITNYLKQSNIYILVILILFIGSSEYFYYYVKSEIIKNSNNGSVYTNILDIIRRIITFGLSIIIFKESYQNYMYIGYSFLMIGCILYNFSDNFIQLIDYVKRKFFGYYYFDNIEISNTEANNTNQPEIVVIDNNITSKPFNNNDNIQV